ncbi:hypothetical protein M758_12G027300 [Ceratodon purpureus]|nr:hypothetical protein M758_12G027300 [Ceratodon purpureus]
MVWEAGTYLLLESNMLFSWGLSTDGPPEFGSRDGGSAVCCALACPLNLGGVQQFWLNWSPAHGLILQINPGFHQFQEGDRCSPQ